MCSFELEFTIKFSLSLLFCSDRSLTYSSFEESLTKYQFNRSEVSPLSNERILTRVSKDLINEMENFISIEG